MRAMLITAMCSATSAPTVAGMARQKWKMKSRLDEVRPALRPTAKLAEAIDFVLNRWDVFVRYISDGRIPLDNNVIERLFRPVAIGRKSSSFVGGEKGGNGGNALHASGECAAELRGRVAGFDRRAPSDCRHSARRHRCLGTPAAGSQGGRSSRASAGTVGRRIPRSPGSKTAKADRPPRLAAPTRPSW
jgi:hypothetical protein